MRETSRRQEGLIAVYQEHYLKTNPTALNNLDGPEKNLKHLELVSKAADSISDGDLIDRMIHGSEQHWSLLPLHAVASTVKPAMQVYGAMRSQGGGWGSWGPAFPQYVISRQPIYGISVPC